MDNCQGSFGSVFSRTRCPLRYYYVLEQRLRLESISTVGFVRKTVDVSVEFSRMSRKQGQETGDRRQDGRHNK